MFLIQRWIEICQTTALSILLYLVKACVFWVFDEIYARNGEEIKRKYKECVGDFYQLHNAYQIECFKCPDSLRILTQELKSLY